MTVEKCENEVQEIAAVEASSRWLGTFIERAKLPDGVSVRSALAEVDIARRTLGETRARLEALNNELLALESKGLSGMGLEEISLRLQEFGYPLAELSRESVDRLIKSIEKELALSSSKLQKERDEANNLQMVLSLALGPSELEISEFTFHGSKAALSRMKERLATTESLRSKLQSSSGSFPWPGKRALAELALEAESVRKVAAELQSAIGREKQAQATHAESIQRKVELEQQRDSLAPRILRLTKARDTLHALRRDHSIIQAMKEALDHNRAGIEQIFSRINSPAEFSGLG